MSTFSRMIVAVAGVVMLSGCSSIFTSEPPMILIPHTVNGDGDAPWLDEATFKCQNGYDAVTLTPEQPSHDIESRANIYGPHYSVLMQAGETGDIEFTFVEGLPSGVIVEYADHMTSQRISYDISHRTQESRILAQSGSGVSYSTLVQATICY
ncbi:MAG: hypothetical protein Q4B06_00055 [Candidatus Saccharibacteria bacterium]|nr:hypothetical protein [Candidatus Saccharibacteria bacterium]